MRVIFFIVAMFFLLNIMAQKNPYILYKQENYDVAVELFNKGSYKLASNIFYELSKDDIFKKNRKYIKCKYYYAICETYTGQKNSEKVLEKFLKENKNEVDKDETYYMIGKYFYDNLDFKRSELWYNKVDKFEIIEDKKNDLFFELGFSQYKNKNYEKAKPNLYIASKSKKYMEDAIYYYSHIAYEEEMYASSLENISKIKKTKKYINIVPEYEIKMYFLHRRYSDAIKLGEKVLDSTNNKYSEICKILGDCYFQLKKYKQASEYFEKGSRVYSNKEYYKLGYSYYSQKKYKQAINNFNKIINENSKMSQSAYYYLADSYLKEEKKTEAFNAFKKTSEMDFDTIIKKDAFYNYIKLSYDIGNPYKRVVNIIDEYLKKYPNDDFSTELKNIRISSLIFYDDYDKALKYGKENKENSHKVNILIQQVSFRKGIRYIELGKYKDAIPHMNNTIKYGYNLELKNKAIFWRGECNYKIGNNNAALIDLKDFALSTEVERYYEYQYLNYNLGYIYFNLKDFNQSLKYFNTYEEKVVDSLNKLDAILRIADCNFANENYTIALDYYRKYIYTNTHLYIDYAHYNMSLCLGLIGKTDKKIEKLKYIQKTFPKSYLSDKIYYELGMSYMRKNSYDNVIKYFDELEKRHPYSDLVIKAKLKKALLFYNQGEKEKSISMYKDIVENYFNSKEAVQSMKNLRKIYIEIGKINDYVEYSKDIEFTEFSNEELDSLVFFEAEKNFIAKDFEKAIPKLNDYRKRFPNGNFIIDATFYNAESLFLSGEKEQSENLYNDILNKKGYTEFYSKSSKRLITIYGDRDDFKELNKIFKFFNREYL